MKIAIKNGRVVDPKSQLDARQDVYIAAGKIVAVGSAPDGFHANREIDAAGLVVCPGLVDLAARLREPGLEHKATLESEMAAAIAGGVTSLSCPPDTDPPLDEPGLVEMLKHRAKSLNQARVFPLGALTQQLGGERLTEMGELVEAGCVAFSQADAPLVDTNVLLRAMQYAATFGYTVWLRPQDAYLSKDGVAHDGEVASRLGLPAIPVSAETTALSTYFILAEQAGVKLHICRVSSREGVELVRAAKARGLPVTCDVAAHHLHMSEMDIGYFDANCHVVPPFRSKRDREALRDGVKDGTIDAICSDHAPVDDDAKIMPFGEAEAGVTGLELLLPLALKWGDEAKASLADTLARVTTEPARILGLANGHLAPGQAADLCLFDPELWWKVEARSLRSLGRNTPFYGLEVRGKVRCTLVDGHVVYEG